MADKIEDAKGKLKEAAGDLTGNDSMAKEGAAQQQKEEAKDTAQQKQAEAQKAQAEAQKKEAEQEKA